MRNEVKSRSAGKKSLLVLGTMFKVFVAHPLMWIDSEAIFFEDN